MSAGSVPTAGAVAPFAGARYRGATAAYRADLTVAGDASRLEKLSFRAFAPCTGGPAGKRVFATLGMKATKVALAAKTSDSPPAHRPRRRSACPSTGRRRRGR